MYDSIFQKFFGGSKQFNIHHIKNWDFLSQKYVKPKSNKEKMHMLTITKKFEFSASHSLPNHPGNCSSLHGHNYGLEVTIGRDRVGENSGMIMDFGMLKGVVENQILSMIDHTHLNDVLGDIIPTAENLVLWIQEMLFPIFNEGEAWLQRIRLYETSTCYAEWTNDETLAKARDDNLNNTGVYSTP
jgi:6-pyruvoyltetrahydropterin/6-carboxytetrahydropterin synthase